MSTPEHATTFHDVLNELRNAATDSADLGTRFEQLMCAYFKHEASYAEQFSKIWRWCDFPHRDNKPDTGIDLVAENCDGSGFVAIQCKCYDEDATVAKSDIDSFLATSSKAPSPKAKFVRRIIVSTTANWSKHAEDTRHNQTPPVQLIGLDDLNESNIDWSRFSAKHPSNLVTKAKKELRPHQVTAVDAVCEGFKTVDRGKMIMACGTGKTFTSLKIAERFAGRGGNVVFLVPSLSLLSQTLHEWQAESAIPLRCYAVCSDEKVGKRAGKDDDHIATTPDDLAIPATTNARTLAQHFVDNTAKHRGALTVVFATYQSIEVLNTAQKKHGVPEFDLVICDEAHRTTGVTLASEDESQFVRVHDEKFLRAKRRLYMTATPRLYTAESKKKADDAGAILCSMDDEKVYGKELYKLGFSEAVEKDLLADYKVIVLSVNEKYISRIIQREFAKNGSKDELTLGDAAKMIGCWNGLSKKFTDDTASTRKKHTHNSPMRRAVCFTSLIAHSKRFRDEFAGIIGEYLKQDKADKHALSCEVEHVDGKMDALQRNKHLQWLKEDTAKQKNYCRILSNAKCLSEGVDVPALDAVIFLNPRKSQVDVVQSVGRVMRKAPGKEYGYIILPVAVPEGTTPHEALDNNEAYRVVWEVLQALRAHDDRFEILINQIELNKEKPDKIIHDYIGDDTEHDSSDATSGDSLVRQEQLRFEEIEEWRNALFAKIVIKCGEKRYWEQWASDVAEIAKKHSDKIRELLSVEEHDLQFQNFLAGLRLDLNPDITEDDAIEMLSQHLITKPVFDALFGNSEFTAHNPVSQAMEKMITLLEDVQRETERDSLTKFYESVKKRATGVDNAAGKQKIVIELYDKFFKTAFPLMAQRLGIVYTPIEVVDFILHSVDYVLRTEFGGGFNAKGNDILDPFTGTGTFIVRLLQSGLIEPKNLRHEYEHEIHANELVLLAYYIAAINIENTFHEVVSGQLSVASEEKKSDHRPLSTDHYLPFPGIVLADTFTMLQEKKLIDENSKRAKRQRDKKIRVIIGNPPYSAGQRSENDANKNTKYNTLDKRIADTYARHSTAVLKNSVYDSYIRAIRWASDRIGDKGVIGFVTNGSFIDGNAMDGLRKCLAEDFTDIYIFNCRGNARTSGEQRRKEKGNVFDAGTRTPVAITILVKNPDKR
ncbi:MAG: DEAD/DEAH box helicase family protein [Thermoguttaceae bacterium]